MSNRKWIRSREPLDIVIDLRRRKRMGEEEEGEVGWARLKSCNSRHSRATQTSDAFCVTIGRGCCQLTISVQLLLS